MTLAETRKLVAEYFHVESPKEADEILCAALRVTDLPTYRYQGQRALSWWAFERGSPSMRALFGHAFKVDL